jgi:hypothetical protein
MDYHQMSFVCSLVLRATRPVLLLVRTPDGFEFLCGDEHDWNVPESMIVAGIGHVLDHDVSLMQLMNLEAGEEAERAFVGGEWTRRSSPDE